METFNKYGNKQARIALERYILYGDAKHITNNNNARNNIKSIDYSKIIDILKEGLNVDAYTTLEDLCDYFIDKMESKYMNKSRMY